MVARAGDGQPACVAHAVGAVVGGGQAGGGQGGEVGVGQQAGRPADDGLVDLGAPGVGGVGQRGCVGAGDEVQPARASGAEQVQQFGVQRGGVAQSGGDGGRVRCLRFGQGLVQRAGGRGKADSSQRVEAVMTGERSAGMVDRPVRVPACPGCAGVGDPVAGTARPGGDGRGGQRYGGLLRGDRSCVTAGCGVAARPGWCGAAGGGWCCSRRPGRCAGAGRKTSSWGFAAG